MSLPENYRYIMLNTVFYKIYAKACNFLRMPYLNTAGQAWQAGFRKAHSCLHHVFTLCCIVEHHRASDQPVYACFVDFRKAFDMVPRATLWEQLEKVRVPRLLIRAIQLLYETCPIQIRTTKGTTGWIQSTAGVRQGCLLSPTLFALFMQDLQERLRSAANLSPVTLLRQTISCPLRRR